jgi:PHD/YefM family antitoxin component YafN of YafNO toxin-antitoxin module
MGGNPEIHSLEDFRRNTPDFVRRMKASGDPILLTIDGQPGLVVLDAAAYQGLVDRVEEAAILGGIRQGLEEMRAGLGRPAEEVFEEIRAEFRLSREA